ncbi:MAG: hypothetical protein LM517_03020 [Nitrosomonas sp.]|nr:hypothetical protein [Nitrosomonas sp.]
MISDRKKRDDEIDTEKEMQIIEVAQPGVDAKARSVKKGGNSVLGYKQHTIVDGNSLETFVKPILSFRTNCFY